MPLDLSRFLRTRNPDDPRVRAARTRDVDRTIELCRALLTERGEVSGARVAAEVLGAYQRLSEEEVEWFFDRLVKAFSVDAEAVRQAAAAYRLDASPANLSPCKRPSNRHARNCSGAATWHREARPSWWKCVGGCCARSVTIRIVPKSTPT